MPTKLALATLSILFATSISAIADVTHPTCVQNSPTEYKLSYTLTGNSRQVEILASTDSTGNTGLQSLLKTSDTIVTVHAGKPGQRIYFFLKPDHGVQREVSIRRLPLDGTPNFRDLGGYETTDGRFVRWGVLYRSGVLTYLTDQDLTYLSQLGVRVVCDFRTHKENADAPEKYVADPNVDRISLPIGENNNGNTNGGMQALLAANPTPDQLRDWMSNVYRDFAFKAAPEYAKVFAQLEEDHLPLLYHCSAGKDRTGVFSALVLLTLGVPEPTVLNDYSLTTNYLREAENSEANRKMMATSGAALSHLSSEQRNVLMAADPEYLRRTLHAIDEKYGSFDAYRREALHISDADVEKLKSRLLTN